MDKKEVFIIEGCIVCKTCEFTCPEVFKVEEKSLTAEVVCKNPPDDIRSKIIEAIKLCPENVIKYKKK